MACISEIAGLSGCLMVGSMRIVHRPQKYQNLYWPSHMFTVMYDTKFRKENTREGCSSVIKHVEALGFLLSITHIYMHVCACASTYTCHSKEGTCWV